ncbi:chemotaxis protein CheA [Sulfuricurvum sp.]|uniref:chemotaxis protein CheA n=1 Tax=Sulfuricurvum sp. TaxID=2025608 RepID=UPI003BB7CBD8
MNEELQYFQEDAKAQLDFMEQALMDIVEQGVNDDAIGAIFRAMHTIKGTAGMFDFTEIVSFTHVAENVLDLVRQKKITLTEEILEILLRSKDHVEEMVSAAINALPLSEEIRTRDEALRAMLATSLTPTSDTNQLQTVESPTDTLSGERVWHISLRFKEEFFKTGMDILSIFDFFSSEGDIITILPVTDFIPMLDSYDPFIPYIGFEIFFLTSNTCSAIEEIFEFVAEDIDLILFPSDNTASLQELCDKRPEVIEVLKKASMYEHLFTEGFPSITPNESQIPPVNIVSAPPVTPTPLRVPSFTEPSKESPKNTSVAKSAFLRVDFQKIDLLINQLSEMVITNAKIVQISEKYDDSELEEATQTFTEMLDALRDTIMDIRMVQVEESFAKLRRNVSDVAKKLGKTIDFSISGGETELDKAVVEKLNDPLVHMLRNSIDHGIESAEERRANGKTDHGQIWLRAYPESGTIVIEIEDDGRGLNTHVIHRKAIEKGIVSSHDTLSDEAINMLIFHPGFSTSDTISDISGRGVGMDVVKQNIESLKGRIDIINRIGLGCKFIITLPLTLAIIDGFLVQAGSTKYIIPQQMIQEVLELRSETLIEIAEAPLLNLRGELLPILDVKHYFQTTEHLLFSRQNIVIIRYGSYRAGLIVEELFGEHQTVVKTLGPLFQKVPGISGGSILGSGEIALIFDIPALIEYVIQHDQR